MSNINTAWQPNQPVSARRLEAMRRDARAANAWNVTGADEYEYIEGVGHRLVIGETTAGTATWTAEITSAATTAPYSWKEVHWDAAGADWQDKSGGLTGSTNARHLGGFSTGPLTGALVNMWATTDDTGADLYLFDIISQPDSTFAHRTTAGGSITLGNREDRSLSTTQIVQIGTSGLPAAHAVDSQTSGKAGWVETETLAGVGYSTADKEFWQKWRDVEFDCLGRRVSTSAIFSTLIIDLTVC